MRWNKPVSITREQGFVNNNAIDDVYEVLWYYAIEVCLSQQQATFDFQIIMSSYLSPQLK